MLEDFKQESERIWLTVFKSQGWGLSSSYSSVQGLLSAPQFRAYYYHIHLDERVGLHPSLHPCPDWRPCDTCQGFRGRAHSGWVSSRPGVLMGYSCLRVLPEGCSAYSSSVLPCCNAMWHLLGRAQEQDCGSGACVHQQPHPA